MLLVSHNRLVSLPEEINHLTDLIELDASCNQLSHLPIQLGDLQHLEVLNLRKNLLVELPKGRFPLFTLFVLEPELTVILFVLDRTDVPSVGYP